MVMRDSAVARICSPTTRVAAVSDGPDGRPVLCHQSPEQRGYVMSQEIHLTGIDMSIGQLVVLFLKIAIAAIPAMILLSLLYAVIGMMFMAAFWPAMQP